MFHTDLDSPFTSNLPSSTGRQMANKTVEKLIFSFRAKVSLYEGKSAWHFIILNKKVSKEIRIAGQELASAWGSIKIVATVGDISWKTSLFPSSGEYYLPLKKAIRKSTGLKEGDSARGSIELILD